MNTWDMPPGTPASFFNMPTDTPVRPADPKTVMSVLMDIARGA